MIILLSLILLSGANFCSANEFFPVQKGSETGAALLIGKQEATYTISTAGGRLPNYRNNGFVQRFYSKTNGVTVQVSNTPLMSRYKAQPVPEFPQNCRSLEDKLMLPEIKSMSLQVAVVINWLRLNIQYTQTGSEQGSLFERRSEGQHQSASDHSEHVQELPPVPTTLEGILEQRRADCVGLSMVARHFLSLLGIKSRFVTGVAFQKDDPARLKLKGPVLHRWLEVYYPDVGWVFSDPSGKINYIEATYVVFGVWGVHRIEPLIHQLYGQEIELLAFYNGFKYSGFLSGLDPRVGIRPNHSVY